MNCCDEYGSCNQGRDCPVRTGKPVRKVRAGGPPPADLPIQSAEEERDQEISAVSVALWLAVIFCVCMAALNLAWGNVSFAFLWG